jgi:hypothetical protein
MLNLVITCGGPYDMGYANKAVNMFRRNCKIDFKPWCITERPGELHSAITPIKPSLEVTGWWNKVLAFGPNMPDGWIVVIDVDLVIVNDITAIIEYAMKNTKQVAAYSDAMHWMDCKFSSSLMVFKSGSLNHIYENFKAQWPSIKDFPGGDQVWTYPQLDDVLFLDEVFPEFKRSFKVNLVQREGTGFMLPNRLPGHVKIIDFHGEPKPHQMKQWAIVSEHWR